MSGIDRERIVNRELLDLFGDYINCFVCKLIVKDPFTCEECETSCCKNCFNHDFNCKKCKSKNLKFLPSVWKNFLYALKVRCKNCEFIDTYNKIDDHQNFCFEKVTKSVSEEANKDSFFKSCVEVSQEISKSYEKVNIDRSKQEVRPLEEEKKDEKQKIDHDKNQSELLKDLTADYENKDLNDVVSLCSDQNDDKFSRISCNFLESIQNQSHSHITGQIVDVSSLKKKGEEGEKDFIIRSLEARVMNLEQMCTSLINETQQMKNSLKFHMYSSTTTGLHSQSANVHSIQANKNLLSQKGMIIFNPCTICSKITNVKIQLKCDNCTKQVCPDCNYTCATCNTVTCKTCGGCGLCKDLKYCYKCKYSCQQCVKNKNAFCKQCVRVCEVCNNEDSLCKRCCNFKCTVCKKISCLKCIWNCKSCYSSFCTQHPSENCKSCGARNCVSCFKKCVDCESNICGSCMYECSKCNLSVCKKCSINYGKDNRKSCKLCLNK